MDKEKSITEIVERATHGSAGYDIVAPNDVTIHPNQEVLIDTGLKITENDFPVFHAIVGEPGGEPSRLMISPLEYVLLVFPRSSYGRDYGFRFLNTVSVIDSDYRDTIKLLITVNRTINIKKGDRIAQFIIFPFCVFADEKRPVKERNGGLGSTGR